MDQLLVDRAFGASGCVEADGDGERGKDHVSLVAL